MTGKVICIAKQKGGVGGTTIATNIAATMVNQRKDVVILDTDIQGSASRWTEYRQETNHRHVPCLARTGDVRETIRDLKKRYDFVIVDVAGKDSREQRFAMVEADIIVSPVRPSQQDIETMPTVFEMVNSALAFNKDAKAYVLLNLCPTNPNVNEIQQATEMLKDASSSIKLLNSRIHDRKIYRDAYPEGKSVTETRSAKAKVEILNLISELGL